MGLGVTFDRWSMTYFTITVLTGNDQWSVTDDNKMLKVLATTLHQKISSVKAQPNPSQPTDGTKPWPTLQKIGDIGDGNSSADLLVSNVDDPLAVAPWRNGREWLVDSTLTWRGHGSSLMSLVLTSADQWWPPALAYSLSRTVLCVIANRSSDRH